MPRSAAPSDALTIVRSTRARSLVVAAPMLLLFSAAPSIACSQNQGPHDYVAQLTGLITEEHEKRIHQALSGWEALERSDVSRAAHRLKFTTPVPMVESDLNERLAGTGVAVFWLAEEMLDGTLVGDSFSAHAFPTFQDTGDPAADNARYETDKAAWTSAHPNWVDRNTHDHTQGGTDTEQVK